MTALPWDRFSPIPAEPDMPSIPPIIQQPPVIVSGPPGLPPSGPVGPPAPAAPIDVGSELSDALDKLWPAIRDMLGGYLRDSWGAIRKGETVDLAHPTITATDVSGRELVVADARSRSWRTFLQGLIFDLLAGLTAAIAVLAGADPFVKETWIAFGILVFKTFVSAGISYLMRLRATPTIRTKGPEIALMPLPRPVMEDDNDRSAA
jgi:hypothetical protein